MPRMLNSGLPKGQHIYQVDLSDGHRQVVQGGSVMEVSLLCQRVHQERIRSHNIRRHIRSAENELPHIVNVQKKLVGKTPR